MARCPISHQAVLRVIFLAFCLKLVQFQRCRNVKLGPVIPAHLRRHMRKQTATDARYARCGVITSIANARDFEFLLSAFLSVRRIKSS